MQRYSHVIKVKKEKLQEYIELHANPWEGVNNTLKKCNIQNYSIYHFEGLLFSYYEYTGDNYEEDMKKMGEDELTRKWWALTDPCQEPVESAKEGVWWSEIQEVFHLD